MVNFLQNGIHPVWVFRQNVEDLLTATKMPEKVSPTRKREEQIGYITKELLRDTKKILD